MLDYIKKQLKLIVMLMFIIVPIYTIVCAVFADLLSKRVILVICGAVVCVLLNNKDWYGVGSIFTAAFLAMIITVIVRGYEVILPIVLNGIVITAFYAAIVIITDALLHVLYNMNKEFWDKNHEERIMGLPDLYMFIHGTETK